MLFGEKNIQEFKAIRNKLLESQYINLNDRQREAVYAVNGPVLILAGAGSGKTTVLVNRIAHMIRFGDSYNSDYIPADITEDDLDMLKELARGVTDNKKAELSDEAVKLIKGHTVHPASILAITFTNKAAKEMKERIERLMGALAERMWIGTFHSTCVRILRREIDKLGFDRSFVIFDTSDQLTVIKDCLKELNLNEKNFPPRSMLDTIGRAKDELIDPRSYTKMYQSDYRMSKIASIYELYQKKLFQNNALDFDDIILMTIRLFIEHDAVLDYYQKKFRYVLVDEYQDTNTAQYTLVSLLSQSNRNLCVVGDDDQSIYGWRGANIRNILDFEKEFKDCKTIKLEQNYRSTQLILDAANNVIKNNSGRKSKNLWTQNIEGSKIQYYEGSNEYHEATFVSTEIKRLAAVESLNYKDFAILYRVNAQSRILEEMLMREAIPYKILGGLRFYDRKEIKDIIAYLRVIQNPSDNIGLKRIINVPKRGIGNTTVDNAESVSIQRGCSIFSVIDSAASIPELQRAASKLEGFVNLISRFRIMKDEIKVSKLIEEVIKQSGIMDELKTENTEEAQSRLENIQELISGAIEFEEREEDKSLGAYLANISLVADIDNLDEERNNVVLMTLHSAKGLEFPAVFMVGMEEGIFPGYRSATDENELEEERRLCYVGIT
ncbi:MAG: UvrD-helicase domain-containing protein, partial [Bacillota bacterium]|nr:UvrD-helicase domain-containing protein [Bacillota bacterium]